MIEQRYSKTRSQKGHIESGILRFLPTCLSLLLVKYLVLVKPIERVLIGKLYSQEEAIRHDTFLFVGGGKCFSDEKVCSLIQAGFVNHMNKAIDVRSCRQIIKGFCDAKLRMKNLLIDDDSDDDENIYDCQRGHSGVVASEYYGVSTMSVNGIDHIKAVQYLKASTEWQNLIGIMSNVDDSPDILPNHEEPFPIELSSNDERPFFATTPTEKSVGISYGILDEIPKKLRHLYGPNASFKSEYQKEAVLSVIQTTEDQLLIMPTGSGKSLLYVLPALVLNKCAVVVVPTNALVQHVLISLTNLRVSVEQFRHSFSYCVLPSVLLVVYDTFVSESFKAFLLQKQDSICFICLDEIHKVQLDINYRPIFERIPFVRNADLDLKFVLLSGTLPIAMEKELQEFLFLKKMVTFRTKCVRRDLNYSFRTPTEFIQAINHIYKALEQSSEQFLVFCKTTTECEFTSQELNRLFRFSVTAPYHSKLNQNILSTNYHELLDGKIRGLVATDSLGAGIEFPLLRTVLHLGLPYNLLDYVQHVGRIRESSSTSKTIVFPLTEDLCDGRINQNMKNFFSYTKCKRKFLSDVFDKQATNCFIDTDLPFYCQYCASVYQGQDAQHLSSQFNQHEVEFPNLRPVQPRNILSNINQSLNPLSPVRTISSGNNNVRISGQASSTMQQFQNQVAVQMKRYIFDFENRNYCGLCLVQKSELVQHRSSKCPLTDHRCAKCLNSDHFRSSCCLKYPNGYCFKCCLPGRIGEIVIHEPNKFAHSCTVPNGDIVKVVCIAAWIFKKSMLLNSFPQITHFDHDRFVNWLFETENMHINLYKVFCVVMQTLGF